MKFLPIILVLALSVGAFAQKPPQKSKEQAQQDWQQVDDAKLKKFESAYKAAKAAFTKNPKDAKLKKKYVDSTFVFGMGNMYSQNLPPRAKYTNALTYFREVLKADPKHKMAKENYDGIVKIYKQMGRPVPGEKPSGVKGSGK